mgnify:CR=1 FL=1
MTTKDLSRTGLVTMDIKDQLAKEYLTSLEGTLPRTSQIEFLGRKVTLISYELSTISPGLGPQMLAIGDNVVALKGSCGTQPHFYSIGEHLYFRLVTSVCETGYILVGNYVVLSDNYKLEWETADYAN